MNDIKPCKVVLRNDHCFVVAWNEDIRIQFPANIDPGTDTVYVKKTEHSYEITEKPKKKTKKAIQSLEKDSE